MGLGGLSLSAASFIFRKFGQTFEVFRQGGKKAFCITLLPLFCNCARLLGLFYQPFGIVQNRIVGHCILLSSNAHIIR